MAKQKLTKAQRKARKQASYIRAEYYKNFDALDYLRDFVKIAPLDIPNKITKASLKKIRRIYKEARKEAEQAGAVLPTKREMTNIVREEPTQQYRQSRAEPQDSTGFNPHLQYIEAVRNAIDVLTPRDVEDPRKASTVRQFEEARLRLYGSLDYAIAKTDEVILAQALASNEYVQRIADIDNMYAWEMILEIDNNLVPLLEASMNDALEKIYDME